MNKKTKLYTFLKIIIITVIIISSLLLYSRFIATKGLNVKEYKITSSIVSDNFHGFKIVHMSDIHYGRTIKSEELKKIVNEINLLKPDIVVLTGDLIDKDTKLTEEITNEIKNILKQINATVGKYAISGEDDLEFSEWGNIINFANFKNLNDSYELIYNKGYSPILITGIKSNLHSPETLTERYQIIEEYLNSTEQLNSIYKILLMHEPDFVDNINYSYFNLILAGHSHKGQINLPLFGAVNTLEGSKKYYDEYYKLQNSDLYISSGLGTSDYDFRFLNKPSINFYRLTNK